MKSEVISFRPGQELMTTIMADCEKLGITSTEWVIRKVYTAMEKNDQWAELSFIKKSIWNARRILRWHDNREQAIEILNQVHDSLNTMLKK